MPFLSQQDNPKKNSLLQGTLYQTCGLIWHKALWETLKKKRRHILAWNARGLPKCHNKKPSQRVPFTTKLCVKMMVKNMGTISWRIRQ